MTLISIAPGMPAYGHPDCALRPTRNFGWPKAAVSRLLLDYNCWICASLTSSCRGKITRSDELLARGEAENRTFGGPES